MLLTTYTFSRDDYIRSFLAAGGSVIKFPSPLNVLKDTYDHSCHWARSTEYQHF